MLSRTDPIHAAYGRLVRQVTHHARLYHIYNAPEISDFAYDMLYKRLEDMEARYPELVTPLSPTQRVGSGI